MSALEKEILEKFHQLDSPSQLRVLKTLNQEVQAGFDYASWWADVESLQSQIQTQIQTRLGDDATVGALSLLDELREEAS